MDGNFSHKLYELSFNCIAARNFAKTDPYEIPKMWVINKSNAITLDLLITTESDLSKRWYSLRSILNILIFYKFF